jgi:hypothetical protein
MLRNVAAVVVNDFLPFEFGVICEVFGIDRSQEGLPGYDFAVDPDVLYVDDDPVISSAGTAAGIDAYLYLVPCGITSASGAASRPTRTAGCFAGSRRAPRMKPS